ncbi:MAG: hypothetical protein FVQ82_06575 [Planctomycetes bacterium]|nr:hypothetical protein [Planctomycetota bacterium]
MSTKNYPKKQEDDALEDMGIYEEDEINLLDYLAVIWNWKWFILIATALPTLAVGLLMFLSPRTYTTSYVYDVRDDVRDNVRDDTTIWNLNEKNYNVMLSRFYSQENLTKLADKMQKNGLAEYAAQVRGYAGGLKGFVEFGTDPAFFDLSKLNVTDQTQLKDILNMQASLLNVKITGKPQEAMQKISSIIRYNIENVISLYPVQDQLEAVIRSNKSNQAGIESSRFSTKLALEQNRNVLAGLKNIKAQPTGNAESNITLRYDIGSNSQYLPMSYQIQAVESKIVALEQEDITTEIEYQYYTDLVSLNESILARLNEKVSGDYSITQFKTFLTTLPNIIEKPELKDYLSSYTIGIENKISANEPVTETPQVYAIAKGTLKKSVLVLIAASMLSVFAAFLLEAVKKSGSSLLGKRLKVTK